jgi:1,2-diacylglycerol-3-alpha-glucose alpha-1,2-glucosyltransferase
MSVQIYTGLLSLVQKSGVGQAIFHQEEALHRAGVSTTERATPSAHIVHCNTVFPDTVLTAFLSRLAGKKVVYYGHSTMEDFRNSFRGSNRLAPLFRRWISFCYNSGSVVITPTEYSKSLLQSYGVRRPIYSLSNGVDTQFFAPSAERRRIFRKKYHLTDDAKAVISVGHYIGRKGLPEFVELARSMPEIHFFWFGYTNPKLIPQEIQDAVDSAPSNLIFPGFVSREELRDAYCGCDVFAFLSHEETEGIVVLEALSCGISTVVRDIPVYSGWLEHGVNVYKASDSFGFQNTVSGLLYGSLPSLAEAGLQVAHARSLTAVGNQLKQIYQQEQFSFDDAPAKAKPAFLSVQKTA